MLFIIVIVILVLALGGGAWGIGRYGVYGFSPAALVLTVLVVLYFTGHISFN